MLTLIDFSFLIVTQAKDLERLNGVYNSIRHFYPQNEIVIVYENQKDIKLNSKDKNLIEVYTDRRVYVSVGYNLALKACTKKCFVFLHDDTFPSEGFLENMLPHITEHQFCNFTTVEPPIYNDPNTLQKPIKNFGRNMKDFNFLEFCDFCKDHVNKLMMNTVESPFGGFFMAGYKKSIDKIGGFDEYFQPYFYEDSDLMIRMHQAGYTFIHVLSSIVYHMGSLTSRGTQESIDASNTTSKLFIKKWKASWEIIRHYTLANRIPYKKIAFEIECKNCADNLREYIDLVSEKGSSVLISFDTNKLNQKDFEYIQTLPYVLQSIEDRGIYELSNLKITYQ
jgi:GT2 family glycosyltransferase